MEPVGSGLEFDSNDGRKALHDKLQKTLLALIAVGDLEDCPEKWKNDIRWMMGDINVMLDTVRGKWGVK